MSSKELGNLPLAPISDRNEKHLEMIRNTIAERSAPSEKLSMRDLVQGLDSYFAHAANLRRISPEKEEVRLHSYTGWKYLQ
jgi:hypothetical protein